MAGPWEAFGASQAAPAPEAAAAADGPWAAFQVAPAAPAAEPPKEKFGLKDTWPAKLAKSLYEAVTLPGDVAQGKFAVQPEKPGWITEGDILNQDAADQEIIKRSLDLAGVASPVSAGSKAVAAAAPVVRTEAEVVRANPEVLAAAERLREGGSQVNVPLAIASDNTAVQRLGQGLRNVPIVGDKIPQATGRLVEDLSGATRNVADQFGTGSGPNVANRIGRGLEASAEAETRAATDAARRSDEAVAAAYQRDIDAGNQAIAAREANALEATRQAVGDMSPQDMGAALIQRLRTGEAAARAEKDALYARAGGMDAAVRSNEVQNARSVVAQGLEDAGVVVDPQLTPAASRMMDELQRLSELNIPNRAVGARLPAGGNEARVGVSVQGIEQARKRLSFFRSAAANDADRRAARNVMNQFDDWQSNAFESALLSGNDEALTAFRQARAANASWRDRFFNDENEAGRFVERIVTGEITPQEVSNFLVGAGKVGAKGASSRLLTRIAEATGGDAEAMQAIRGGVWNRLTQATEGAEAKAPAKVANDIAEFLNGAGRDIAERLFTPEQRRMMQSYAQTLRAGQGARELVGDVAKATKPGTMEVQPGPMQQLADTVIGKGGKSDEALFRTIDGYAKSGGKADIQTLAKLVRALPAQDRNDLAGSIIRNLGISPRTGQFSPDVFVSQWQTYTPQAKAILFGNAGPQRQAIDDIAIISNRLKQVGQKFGNPSGTAQNVNLFALAASGLAAPLTTLSSVLGGSMVAKTLASPPGASSAAKWVRAYASLIEKRNAAAMVGYRTASRNLVNTTQSLGSSARLGDFLGALQGPVASRAQNEEQ